MYPHVFMVNNMILGPPELTSTSMTHCLIDVEGQQVVDSLALVLLSSNLLSFRA